MPSWRVDLGHSARDFLEIVWPLIGQDWFGRGELVACEVSEGDKLSSLFDIHSGIDAWHLNLARGMRGIASRVQWSDADNGRYDTFTIRTWRPNSPTEYEKRLSAISTSDGYIYPHVTVQAYMFKSKRELRSVGAIRTADLFRYVENKGYKTFCEIQNVDASSRFIAVKWSELKAQGLEVKIWTALDGDGLSLC